MRRIITCLIALLFFSLQLIAQQVPDGFNYQSIARDAMGLPIVNSQIKLRITVRQNNISGTDVWQETQTATTNQFGLINLVIGNGIKSGGLASITGINSIDWSSDNFFIVVEVDNGGTYVSLGITQFQSVPYALASDNALKIQGTKVGAIIPTANEFLKFNALSGQWEPGNISGANGGTVISVGGIGPITITGNAGLAPQVNILQSSVAQDGYLSSLDWAVFTNKLGTTTGFSGNVSGTYDAITVTGIQNIPVTSTAPTYGQILMYDGIQWVPTTTGATSGVTTVIGSGEISVTAGSSPVISISTASGISNGIITAADYISFSNKLTINSIAGGDLSGPYNNLVVTKIGGVPVSLASAPTGSVLSFNGIGFVPAVLSSTVNITSTTPGVSASGSTINITTADGTNFGLLTPTDYTSFTNKVGIASSASGDVLGSYQDGFTVTGLGTKSLNITGILPGQVLSFNGTTFVPGTPSASQLTSVTGINGIIVGGSGTLYSVDGSNLITVTTVFGGDLSGTYNSITVNKVQNVPFSLAGITNGQYLYYNGTSIVGFNVPSAIVPTITGINGVTLNTNTGYDFTISGQTLATYSGDNLLTTLTGTFPNFTIAGIAQTSQFTTLTGSNGLSVAGSGLSQTIMGQSFVGSNGIVVSSTGNTFTISNTTPGLSLFGDGLNTSVTGSNNNYTVLGIGSSSQWISTTTGVFINSFVGIGTLTPPTVALTVQSTSSPDLAFFESFHSAGSTINVYNGGTDGARIKLSSGSIFIIENRVSVAGFNFSGNDFLTFNNVNSIVGINAIGGVVNIGRSGQSSNLSVTGITYTKGLMINSLSNGLLTVDGLGNVTTTSLSFSTTQTTLTGSNGLSVSGSGFSQTIIGQSFIAGSGIVITSSGNNFTIINTIPGVSLFGDNINTSVVGSNNNYSVLGIGISSQWISTTAGIFVNSFVGIGTDNPLSKLHVTNGKVVIQSSSSISGQLQIGGTNPGDNAQIVFVGGVAAGLGTNVASSTSDGYNAVWGLGIGMDGIGTSKFGFYNAGLNANIFVIQSDGNFGINEYNPGEKLTVKGNSSISGISFTNDLRATTLSLTGIGSGILTVDGLGNVTTTSLNFSTTQTTLTGANGLSIAGSGFSQTIIGQNFIGANGIVVSSTGIAFTISNTAPGLSLSGDGVNTSVVGTNNNYTVLGISTTSQWVSTAGGVYYPIGVGIHALPSGSPLTIGTSAVYDIDFVPGVGGGTATIHAQQDLILLSDNNLALSAGGSDRLNILSTGEIGIGTSTPNEKLTVQGNSSVSGIGYASGFKASTLTLIGIGSGILTVDGLGNVTTTTLSFATTQTTITGANGLSVVGSSFSQTIIGQNFIGTNGIVVSSTGNTFIISNTTPGLNLFGDNVNTSVVGSNNSYTVLGIGSSSQWLNTVGGIYYGSFVGIGMSPYPGSVFSIKSRVGLDPLVFQRNGGSPYRMAAFSEEPNGGSLYLYDGSSNAIPTRITSDNLLASYFTFNLGIGTTTPNELLTVYGNSSTSGIGYFGTIIGNNLTGAAGSIVTVDGFGKFGLGTLPSGTSQWLTTTTSFNTGIVYTNSFVGIGNVQTAAPNDANLHINSNGNASILLDGTSPAISFWSTVNDASIFTDAADNNKMKFASALTIDAYADRVTYTRMTIDPINGNIGIGTTNPNERLTIQGNSSVSGIGYASGLKASTLTLTGIGSGILTVDGFGNLTTTSLSFVTTPTISGINGISVITGTGYDFTIDGSAFVNTTTAGLKDVKGSFQNGFTVTGLAGAPINTAAILPGYALQFDGTSIVGSSFVNTILGLGGLTVGTITGGYSIDGSNLVSGTIVGTAGLSVVGSGLSKTVSGAGLVVLQQSMGSTMGSAATTFNTTSGTAMFKVPVKIPANVKTVSISLNAYGLVGTSSADYIVVINGNTSPVSVNSNDPDNIAPMPDLDVSTSQGQTVMLKVYGKVSGSETAAYLQGITITVKD